MQNALQTQCSFENMPTLVKVGNIIVVVCKGRGYNFCLLVPCGGRLFNSHMTYDVTSCTYDVTSGV